MKKFLAIVFFGCVNGSLLAAEPIEIPLWSGMAPGFENSVLEEKYVARAITDGTDAQLDRSLTGVTRPTLSVYLPDAEKSSGTAIIVYPGGGFSHLAIDKEGHDVARWLQSQGIAGFVVKYRTPDSSIDQYLSQCTIPDALQAVRVVRSRAQEWNINPNRIGTTGFSAGGYLAAASGTVFDAGDPDSQDKVAQQSSRPDFIAPIYPLISFDLYGSPAQWQRMLGPTADAAMAKQYSLENRVNNQTPPVFLVHAHDDGLASEHSVRFYLAARQAKVSAELHVFAKGGHGFGIRQRGEPVSAWPQQFLIWMQANGFLEK